MKILITGTAGFIGFHLAKLLLSKGHTVFGFDGMTEYYDVNLKRQRHKILGQHDKFNYSIGMLENKPLLDQICNEFEPDILIHLAAQAGVRYSLENPRAYIDSNVVGTLNVIEAAHQSSVKHLLIASTSSVYGANHEMPFNENEKTDTQLTIYAATKKATESMSHAFSHLYEIPTTVFRFFTVYGPWGRPDMALFKFTKAILEGKTIQVYNYGNHRRDFTYIDDIVEGVIRSLDNVAKPNESWDGSNPDPSTSKAPYKVYNIGAQTPVHLLKFIETLESALGIEAKKELLPMQPGDVPDTYADVSSLVEDTGYQPSTDVETGVKAFVDWYRDFYKV